MSKLTTRTDVDSRMPPEVSAWFSEQTKRLTRNRSYTMDTLGELHGGTVLPGKKTPTSHSSMLDSIFDSITTLGNKIDSNIAAFGKLGTKFDSTAASIAKTTAAKVSAPALRADSAAVVETNTRIAALQREIADMKNRLPAEIPADQKAQLSATRVKWDNVAQLFGDSEAPRLLDGESLSDYTRRLAAPYKSHSKAWSSIDLYTVPDGVLDVVINQIHADALVAAKNPPVTPGVLTMRQDRDAAGRVINRFFGDINVMMELFRGPRKYVTGFPALERR